MNLKHVPYIEAIAKHVSDSTLASKVNTTAIAFAISTLAHLPTSEVESPASHFNMQLLPGINKIVSEWNESSVFDARECIEQVRAFWTIRYTAAHPTSRILYANNASFFNTAFGVSALLSDVMSVFVEENKVAIFALSNIAMAIMQEQ